MAKGEYNNEWGGEDEVLDTLPLVSRQSISREFDEKLVGWRKRCEKDAELTKTWKVLKKYESSGSAVSMAQKLKGRYGPAEVSGWDIHTRRVAGGELTAILVRWDGRRVNEARRVNWLAQKQEKQRKKDERRRGARVG